MLCGILLNRRGDIAMIEVIYKEEKKEAEGNEKFFRIPRNIRQIGEPRGSHKIYIEDYAHTFLEKLAAEGRKQGKTAILFGQINWQEGSAYTFIRGALLVENLDAAPEKVAFTEEIWTWIEEKKKKYFPEEAVVGWFYTMPDLPMEISDSFYRTHLNYFGGNDKVFFLKDPTEQEEAFFVYENGHMARQEGYYIYYEKNQQMQEYMISVQGNMTVDAKPAAEDQAVASFRKIIAGKKEKKEEQKKTPAFMYAASACLTITVLVIGINFLNDYQKMQQTTENITEEVRQVAGFPESTAKEDAAQEQEEHIRDEEQDTISQGAEKENAAQSAEQEEKQQAGEREEAARDTDPESTDGEDEQEITVQDSVTETIREENQRQTEEQEKKEAQTTDSAAEPGKEEAGAGAYESYTIQFGDSLYKISTRKYGTMDMIPEICRLNGISTEDIIYPGQKILLP